MLETTKVTNTENFKYIVEGLQNKATDLEESRNTLSSFDFDQGYAYFMGNIMHRGRYQVLVDEYGPIISMIETQLRKLNKDAEAKIVLENKDEVVKFVKDQDWATADMVGQLWFTKEGRYYTADGLMEFFLKLKKEQKQQ